MHEEFNLNLCLQEFKLVTLAGIEAAIIGFANRFRFFIVADGEARAMPLRNDKLL